MKNILYVIGAFLLAEIVVLLTKSFKNEYASIIVGILTISIYTYFFRKWEIKRK